MITRYGDRHQRSPASGRSTTFGLKAAFFLFFPLVLNAQELHRVLSRAGIPNTPWLGVYAWRWVGVFHPPKAALQPFLPVSWVQQVDFLLSK